MKSCEKLLNKIIQSELQTLNFRKRIEKEWIEPYECERKNRLENIKVLKRKCEEKKRNETVVKETKQNIKNTNKPTKNIEN